MKATTATTRGEMLMLARRRRLESLRDVQQATGISIATVLGGRDPMRRQTTQPDLLGGRTLDTYTAGLGRLYAALDTDAPTMEEHLALHPEDEPCPICEAEPEDMPECDRCHGDGRRGKDCPACDGVGWTYRLGLCRAPGCRCGRLVEATDGE